ncbi:hypothetical protein [Paracoccus sp. SY]|uniref:hypothetical protein n=1 Tax=Paracoccus sp. SY TaxID=1330255 RepID=UPI001304D163|nr:hypothetical protein [Paracoccus sp. SY]
MGIIDPSIITVLQNYKQAQQGSECRIAENIGSVLVDSLRRISLLGPVRKAEKVCG